MRTVIAFALLVVVASTSQHKGIADITAHAEGEYDIAAHAPSPDTPLSNEQLEEAEQGAEKEAVDETKAAGGDARDQQAAAQQALRAVRFAAQTQGTAGAQGAETGDTGKGASAGSSGSSGASGPGMPSTAPGAIPAGPHNVHGKISLEGVASDSCMAMNKIVRGFLATTTGKAVSDVAIDDCNDEDSAAASHTDSSAGSSAGSGSGSGSGSSSKRRRLLAYGAGDSVQVQFSVVADSAEENKAAIAKLNGADFGKLKNKLAAGGFPGVTGARLIPLGSSSSSSGSGSSVEAPKAGSAFGISYGWPVIDDAEIDKQAEIVAEWSVRATYRVSQEKNATAAVVGTRQEVIDFANSAHMLTGDAIDAKNEPGEEVIRHLEKSSEDTINAKEARRRLKVLKDYRKAVSAKRKIATTKRDTAIAELLRLKVLRINTAKQLWMTLVNKVTELTTLLMKRLSVAQKDAEAAKKSEVQGEPKAVVIAKLDASERAQAAARHVKVYMNAVTYKAKCAHQLLEEWQCKVMINCTVAEAAAGDEKPMWSTPTLDALADTMNEAIAHYKEAKDAVPAVPVKKADPGPGPVEKRIMSLEKKYGTGEFAAGNGPGACKLEGNRVGVFVKGKGCQPIPEEKAVTDTKDVAKDAEELAKAVAGSGSGSGSESESGAEAASHATDGEGKSDKKKMSLKQIEERIAKLEGSV